MKENMDCSDADSLCLPDAVKPIILHSNVNRKQFRADVSNAALRCELKKAKNATMVDKISMSIKQCAYALGSFGTDWKDKD